MSEEAKTLLVEASLDRSGQILHLHFIGGIAVQTNGKQFVPDKSGRSRAAWESALEELVNLDLVKTLGHKGRFTS